MRLLVLVLIVAALIPAFPVEGAEAGCAVVLDGQVIMRVYDSSAARADSRAQLIKERLLWCLTQGYRPEALRKEKKGSAVAIYWGKVHIVTADESNARKQGMKPQDLAACWLSNIKKVVTSSALRVSHRSLLVPLGEEAILKISGLAKGRIYVLVKGNSVRCTPDDDTEEITLKGTALGKSTLLVKRSGWQVTVLVHVKDWAGRVPESVVMPVTGEPAPAAILKEAALYAAVNNIVLNPGAKVTLRKGVEAPAFLQKGESSVVSLPLTVEGEGYITVNKTMAVKLTNLVKTFEDPSLLMLSNRPESFDESGILFENITGQAKSVRLLYHHKNTSFRRTTLFIRLTNTGAEPVEMMATPCTSGPDPNEIFVGHQVTSRFLNVFSRKASYQIVIPPHTFLTFSEQEMGSQETASGLFDFHITRGKELKVTVGAYRAGENPSRLKVLEAPFNPFFVHPRGTFENPAITIERAITAGEAPVEAMFAEPPWLIDQETGEPNVGNYGTTYRIIYTVTNSSRFLRRIGFYFSPHKDIARGTFVINGNLVETELLRPTQEAHLHTLELQPGGTETVELLTMPEGGSNYPAKVIAR
jgi:hypothetical protein